MSYLNITSLILSIQLQLIQKPLDLVHDVSHHYRVYEECLKIAKSEKLHVDHKLILIASLTHDLFDRNGKKVNVLNIFLKKQIKDKNYRIRIIRIIQEHSYKKKQTTLESKVLYDADKLEYVNPFRLMWLNQIHKDGYLDRKVHNDYKNTWHDRAPFIIPSLNFEFAKYKYKKLFPVALKIINNNISLTTSY